MAAGRLPEGRYGRSAPGGRRYAVAVGLLLTVLAGLAVAVIGYRNLGTTPIRSETLGVTVVADNAVSLRLTVIRDDPTHPAVCIVRARSQDGEETGRKELYVPPAAGPIVLSTVVRTSRPPVTADVYGCSQQVPAYLIPTQNH
ncbi:MAG: DUF4307 domain-containing protein [Pseudonocardiaceae bacterium]